MPLKAPKSLRTLRRKWLRQWPLTGGDRVYCLPKVKLKFLIPPAIALALVAIWIGRERSSISLLEQKSAVLKQHLTARASGSGPDAASLKSKSADPLVKEKTPIDWKKVAAKRGEISTTDIGELADYLRLQRKLNKLSKAELISALDEIAVLDLPDDSRRALEQMLLGPLCKKDPECALTRYFERINEEDSLMRNDLAAAMKDWAGKNPVAATAWFDQQIAAGKFDSKSLDGRSEARMQFEGELIIGLISTDPAAAALRLKSLPEDQRAESLRSSRSITKDGDQLAYANLVRSGLPEKAQAGILTENASRMAWEEGYTKITGYLDRIKATPAERAVYVEEAAGAKIRHLSQDKKVTREDIVAMREWVTSQAPETTAKVTGVALAESTRADNKMEFSEAAALATQYHEAAGNDEVLIGFLMAYDPRNGSKEDARVLTQKIFDLKKREEILSRFK
jgi:hypothetical protein